MTTVFHIEKWELFTINCKKANHQMPVSNVDLPKMDISTKLFSEGLRVTFLGGGESMASVAMK